MTDKASGGKQADKYVLPRNELERQRLQNQHQLLTEVFDGRLIIDKTLEFKPVGRVLDSGTGAASWMLDLLNHAPEGARFVGIDVSTAMFPPDIPKNVSLYEMSITDLPSDWDATFDLVNQRLLIAALTKEQWRAVIPGMFRILKPDGAAQIIEPGRVGVLDGLTPTPVTNLTHEVCSAIFEKRNLLGYNCQSELPTMLKDAGFVDVRVELRKAPLGKQWGKVGIELSRNWAEVVRTCGMACVQAGGLGLCGSEAEVDSMVDQAMKEWDETPGIFVEIFAVTGRKPLPMRF